MNDIHSAKMGQVRDVLMGKDEAAQQLGVSPRTIEDWVATRQIPYVKVMNKLIKFRQSTIDKIIEDGSVEPMGKKQVRSVGIARRQNVG